MITNEVCSLLHVVAEVTIRIQGSENTHISETMFKMLEIKEIFEGDTHKIRTQDQTYNQSWRRVEGNDERGRPYEQDVDGSGYHDREVGHHASGTHLRAP